MTRRRKLAFASIAITLTLITSVGLLLVADLLLHRRAERSAGLNRWGYRGPVAGNKQPRELRVAMLGGSTVFGYGLFWDQAIPALLERELAQRDPSRPVSVVNLGYNNEGAFALRPTLEDFAYLDPDVVCLYVGYNDWWGDEGPNTAVYRHESPVFRATGYFPILPLMLKEKAVAIRSGNNLVAATQVEGTGMGSPVVFKVGPVDRASAAALEAAHAVSDAMASQLNRMSPAPAPITTPTGTRCAAPWVRFCDSVYRAIGYSLAQGQKVVVVAPPLMTDKSTARHLDQQRALAGMVAAKFGGNLAVRWVDLSRAVDLADKTLSFDTMHLDVRGNEIVADALVQPVLDLAGQAPPR